MTVDSHPDNADPVASQPAPSPDRSNAALPFRVRSDLIAVRQMSGMQVRWAVKDPAALTYFHFGEREWFLLSQLDGKSSAQDLKDRFHKRFAPFELSDDDLKVFLSRIHRDGLIIVNRHGQGQHQIAQARKAKNQLWLARSMSILAIRFKGIDPQRMLGLVAPIGTILFHPLMMILVAVAALLTGFMGVLQADEIAARLPNLTWFLQGRNLIWMMVALSVVKILHEMGHGMACRHFGGECHEMGLMFLVFTPCLYCNVSDSWMLPNRWHRILVSAAGIYVEVILATLCFVGWYFTHPGILNSVLLNVVFICSVNTLFLNGNPLLRYDGYYILSDLIDVPNLGAQSRQALWGPLGRWLTSSSPAEAGTQSLRFGLIFYAIAAILYRVIVVWTIVFLVYSTLKQFELRAIGQVLIAIIVFGFVFPLLLRLERLVRQPGSLKMIQWARLGILVGMVVAVFALVMSIPIPNSVKAPLLVEAPTASAVYAPSGGRLTWSRSAGDSVTVDDLVCRIESKSLEREQKRLIDEIRVLEVQRDGLALTASFDPQVAAQVGEVESLIEDARNRLAKVETELSRLNVVTTKSGTIWRPRARRQPVDRDRFLGSWEGSPIDAVNEGCYVERGTLICFVGRKEDMQLVLYVGQDQIELVRIGNVVKLRLDQRPNETIQAVVKEVSREELRDTPETLVGSPDFAVRPDDVDGMQPVDTTYRVVVVPDEPLSGLILGSGGRAKIVTDDASLGSRAMRYLRRTVRFEL